MEETISQYIVERSEVEIKVEFKYETHDYVNCYITDLTDDDYMLFEVHYINPEINGVEVSEILVPLDYVVRIATVKSSTKL